MKTFNDNIDSKIKDASNSLPLGCRGIVIGYDKAIKTAVIKVYDEQSGKQMRYGAVRSLDKNAEYKENETVYVAWMGGQRTNPVIVGSLKSTKEEMEENSQKATDGGSSETSSQNAAKAGTDVNMKSLYSKIKGE